MIQLVNARERMPVYHRTYWAKCDGARKMLHWHEFDAALRYYNEVLWVEEEKDVFIPAKPKQAVEFERDLATAVIDNIAVPESVEPVVPKSIPDFVVSVETIILTKTPKACTGEV